MPNTLAHLGVGALVTNGFVRQADLRWVFAGAVIPDVPWIAQRVIASLPVDLNLYDVRVYATVQSSLACSLLLCGALASVASAAPRAFGILALNSALHLVLDALQSKWANGVHFFAPLSWELWNARWFWPESIPTYAMTFGAVPVLLWAWQRAWGATLDSRLSARRAGLGAGLLAAYLVVPLGGMASAEAANNHFVKTLREGGDRAGRYVEFDRAGYRSGEEVDTLRTFARENLVVATRAFDRTTTASVRATFLNDSTLQVHEVHDHSGWPRDSLSLVGLSVVALAWLRRSSRGGHPRV